uniref:AlNc14C19G2008 protein n=1 Tax=Albugo laibachii Nc14 TaxID=890382 RepID=F0W537_9STRA|nr:AlNc14C19G2008 [Albugo laibachii Nc14]|eukprot:CCA16228.1 AlNc14C19G2008 [Albugo laibachii Nc14]
MLYAFTCRYLCALFDIIMRCDTAGKKMARRLDLKPSVSCSERGEINLTLRRLRFHDVRNELISLHRSRLAAICKILLSLFFLRTLHFIVSSFLFSFDVTKLLEKLMENSES